MILYPAIDLFEGKVVRLTQGDYKTRVVYSQDPVATAKEWEQEGAKWIHIVDLEGARSGMIANMASLAAICRSVKANIQFGGGLRRVEDIDRVLSLGVSRVVIGTKALDAAFLEKVIDEFSLQVAVGLDVRGDSVKTSGWTIDGHMTLVEALRIFDQFQVTTLIYTDIEKDGVLQGPNWEKLSGLLALTKSRVILSGGISQISDIEKCRAIQNPNFDGVIIGKALYEKRFKLSEVVRITA